MDAFSGWAAWRHVATRMGCEALFLHREQELYHLSGYSTALPAGKAWGICYAPTVDEEWMMQSAHVVGQSVLSMHVDLARQPAISCRRYARYERRVVAAWSPL